MLGNVAERIVDTPARITSLWSFRCWPSVQALFLSACTAGLRSGRSFSAGATPFGGVQSEPGGSSRFPLQAEGTSGEPQSPAHRPADLVDWHKVHHCSATRTSSVDIHIGEEVP